MDFTFDTIDLTTNRVHEALKALCTSKPRFSQDTRARVAKAIARAGGLRRCISHIRQAARAIESAAIKTKALPIGDRTPPETDPEDRILTPRQVATITGYLHYFGIVVAFTETGLFPSYNTLSRYTGQVVTEESYLYFVFLVMNLLSSLTITYLIEQDLDRGAPVMTQLYNLTVELSRLWDSIAAGWPLVEEIHQQLEVPDPPAPSAPPAPRMQPVPSAPPAPSGPIPSFILSCARRICRNEVETEGDTETMLDPLTFDRLDARSMRVSTQGWCFNKQTILDMQGATDENKHIDPFTRQPTEYFSVQNNNCELVPDDELNLYSE